MWQSVGGVAKTRLFSFQWQTRDTATQQFHIKDTALKDLSRTATLISAMPVSDICFERCLKRFPWKFALIIKRREFKKGGAAHSLILWKLLCRELGSALVFARVEFSKIIVGNREVASSINSNSIRGNNHFLSPYFQCCLLFVSGQWAHKMLIT